MTLTVGERLGTVKVTITLEHLKNAEALGRAVSNRTCVYGQALIEKFGDTFEGCTSRDVICGKVVYRPLSKDQKAISQVVYEFDHRRYDRVATLLPLTVRLKRVP